MFFVKAFQAIGQKKRKNNRFSSLKAIKTTKSLDIAVKRSGGLYHQVDQFSGDIQFFHQLHPLQSRDDLFVRFSQSQYLWGTG